MLNASNGVSNGHFSPRPPMSRDSSFSTCSNDAVVGSSLPPVNDEYSALGELIGQTLRRLDNYRRAETIQRKILMVMYDEIDRTENRIPFHFHN